MPEVFVYIAMSLDGFIATSEGDLSWLEVVRDGDNDYGYAEFLAGVDTILIGRRTYDTVQGFGAWPFEGKKVFVATHRPIQPVADEQAIAGSAHEMLRALGAQGAKKVYLDGGNLVQQALEAGAVTRLIVSVIPVLLGDGISLFGREGSMRRLKHVGTESHPSGLVKLQYIPG